jgi:hypothetical protein
MIPTNRLRNNTKHIPAIIAKAKFGTRTATHAVMPATAAKEPVSVMHAVLQSNLFIVRPPVPGIHRIILVDVEMTKDVVFRRNTTAFAIETANEITGRNTLFQLLNARQRTAERAGFQVSRCHSPHLRQSMIANPEASAATPGITHRNRRKSLASQAATIATVIPVAPSTTMKQLQNFCQSNIVRTSVHLRLSVGTKIKRFHNGI